MQRLRRGGKQTGWAASQYRWPVSSDPSCGADPDTGGAPGFWDERNLLGIGASSPPIRVGQTRGSRRRGERTEAWPRTERKKSIIHPPPPWSSHHLWTSSPAPAAGKSDNWFNCCTVGAARSFLSSLGSAAQLRGNFNKPFDSTASDIRRYAID